MWISNTAASAMMIPIIEATLKELEQQGIGQMYVNDDLDDDKIEIHEHNDNEPKRPTKQTMCYFISTAYAASIGGLGCIVGSGTNLTFKGIYETRFDESPGIDFSKWMLLNVPIMLLTMYGGWIWLQYFFMGLFRPNSVDAKSIRVGAQGRNVAEKLIREKLSAMGPMSFHEKGVGLCFLLSVLLWFFRKPEFIVGWAELITQHKVMICHFQMNFAKVCFV